MMIAMPAMQWVGEDSELLEQLRQSAEDYCARALPLSRRRELRAKGVSLARDAWSEMAELGWAGLVVSEARGGLGLGAAAAVTIARELGRVVANEPFIETALASALILNEADPDERLAALISGDAIFACPLSMPMWHQHQLHARREGDGFVLNGEIPNIPLAPDADYLLLPAQDEHGLAVFVLSNQDTGLTIEAHTVADYSRDGRIGCVNVHCPARARLALVDPDAAITDAVTLAGIGAGTYLLGLCETLLMMTLEYLRTRRQFGRALGSFQALQHRLADLYLQLRLTAAALTIAVDASGTIRAREASLRVRSRACATASLVIREAIQMHGAIGYTEQCDVALYVQRALVMLARFGEARNELSLSTSFVLGRSPAMGDAAVQIQHDAPPQNGDWNTVDDNTFKHTVQQWIEANYPAELRHVPMQLRWSEIRDWHRKLIDKGWAAPAWPREHGGMGLAPNKMLIFIEELERWGVARAPDQGIVMIGPILIEYGTQDQRVRYLRHALTGDNIWCQGYSEPNAGSDLASLSTRAELHGDEFIVNGQKTWTTHGLDATHMYCLVRTDPHAKPQMGISFLLVDLNQPGVTVRPITNLAGHVDFCEVFLDNVHVPRANLVGELNQGWTIAKSLLGHERLFVGSPKLCQHGLHQLRQLAQARGLVHDPVFMDALLKITLDVLDLEALYSEYAAIIKRGDILGADIAILKIWSSESYVRLSEMIVEAAGTLGAHQGKITFGATEIDVLSHYYSARPAPIYAGSNEIQRNIIAKHVLQLPS